MMENKEISIFGEGLDVRDHLYIDDLCKLLLIFIEKKIYGTYNLATEIQFLQRFIKFIYY